MITFADLFGSASQACAEAYKHCADSIFLIQSAFPWSSNDIKNFESNTTNINLTLNQFFNVYMKSFSMPFTHCSDLKHEGYLWQKMDGIKKKWGKRYCIVKNGNFSKFKHDNFPIDNFDLSLCSVKPVDDSEKASCFTIISCNSKPIVLQALSDYERDHWVAVIQNNIAKMLEGNKGQPSDSLIERTLSLPNASPCNKYCADCGAPDPTWACINWGTVICINCGGIHRSLGSHISKVRSLTLDHLDDITLQLFKIIGNQYANSILEQNVTNKITENSTKEEKIAYIQQKYCLHAFTQQVQINLDEAIRTNNYQLVYRAIATGITHHYPNAIHFTASIGDPLMCHLIALNSENPNYEDKGWNALTYASYYGKLAAAQDLLNLGVKPSTTDKNTHPYRIAVLKQDEEMAAVFFPFWDKSPVSGEIPQPPVRYA